MTVVPQQYTLHCVSTGNGAYTIILYYGNDQEIYNEWGCSGVCVKDELHSSNNTNDNTFTITWDTQTISGGQSFSQSVNGDQMYRCKVHFYIDRNRYLTVKGIKIISYIIFNIYFKLQDLLLLLLLKSTRQVLLSLSVGQLIQLMLMDMYFM